MLARLFLKVMGFTIDPKFTDAYNRQRVGIFPHTSKIEACIFAFSIWATNMRGKACFAVAHQYMETPIVGSILAYFGGFPVYKGTGVTKATINYLRENPDKCLAISPEGSLGPKEWQTGFFYIARELQIPIIVFGIDFEKHIIKYYSDEEILLGSEDKPDDRMDDIKAMFSRSGIIPLFPENSNPMINNSKGKITSYIPLQGEIVLLSSATIILGILFYFYL